jgi:hypothetical protein
VIEPTLEQLHRMLYPRAHPPLPEHEHIGHALLHSGWWQRPVKTVSVDQRAGTFTVSREDFYRRFSFDEESS